ncbi:MAG TPA: AAA family ATPase [Rhabdochlamydiaceae bacterium]|nr:AAA family ATPase [Rhabdochlamydiaceae bacterium]
MDKNIKWPSLWKLVEEKQFLYLDYLFAEKVCPKGSETEAHFVASLMAFSRKGHICMPAEEGAQTYPSLICQCENNFYLQKNYSFETTVLQQIQRLLSYPSKTVAEPLGIMTDEQKEAVKKALQYPLSLITGGPGTGKSYTALQLMAAYQKNRIVVCAPTGKAVRLLESKSAQPSVRSGTLHTILNIRSPLDFAKQVEPLEADLVIVDECSMIDAALFARLLSAIGPTTHLVLMGDHDQLPAIESGSFFADLISAAERGYPLPLTRLTRCLRSEHQSLLKTARAVQQGQDHFPYDPHLPNFEALWRQINDHFPMPSATKPDHDLLLKQRDHFRILSAMRKGAHGVDTINEAIVERILSLKKADDYCPLPIIITRNDTQTGLCNGETGFLINNTAVFDSGRIFPKQQLPPFEYAYCLSVHKSQGSEYDHVLLLIPEGSDFFGRELLYTAVTRARKSLKIYASQEMVRTTLSQSSRKLSGLTDRVLKMQ